MPARILPPVSRLRALVEQGMSRQEIADLVYEETGYAVSPSTISSALSRAGISKSAKKFPDEVPWRVKAEHQTNYAARMLRLLGTRRQGGTISPHMEARLDSWLRRLEETGTVVVYVPTTKDGFFYVKGEPDVEGIPIKRELGALQS